MTPTTTPTAAGDLERRLRAEAKVQRGHYADTAKRRAKLLDEAADALSAAEQREHRVCDGCGSSRSQEELDAMGAISCCPERKMLTAEEWHDRAMLAEHLADRQAFALGVAAAKFEDYADQHRAKNTPEASAKALVNDDMASMCRRAVRPGAAGARP